MTAVKVITIVFSGIFIIGYIYTERGHFLVTKNRNKVTISPTSKIKMR